MSEVYVLATARTPVIAGLSGLSNRPDTRELILPVLNELLQASSLPSEKVEDFIWAVNQDTREDEASTLRSIITQAGFPSSIPFAWVNRNYGSGQQAVHFASQAILAHDQQVVIAGGHNLVENQSPEELQTAQLIAQAQAWGLTRTELDQYTQESRERYSLACSTGIFTGLAVPFTTGNGQVSWAVESMLDQPDPSQIDLLLGLPDDGSLNSTHFSPKAVGSAALLLASPETVGRLNLNPLGRLVSRAVNGAGSTKELTGSMIATQRVLLQANLSLPEIGCLLIAERTAVDVLAWIKSFQPDPEKVNPYGGALARGWLPNGEGTLLLADLFHFLERRHEQFGLVVSALQDGAGIATLVERF